MRIAALVYSLAAGGAAVAQQAPSNPVTAEQARSIVPRADLSDLTDAQRGVFLDVATEVFNYAGCQDTLAKCLGAGQKDVHAPRMAALVKQFCSEGHPAPPIVQPVERSYASFEAARRWPLKAGNCPAPGKGPATSGGFATCHGPAWRPRL